jgi:TolB-like protein
MNGWGRQNDPGHGKGLASASLFGRFALRSPDGAEIPISNRRAKALLAMLCLGQGQPIERAQLSQLLWAGRFESHARASLRQCLLDLGKLLEPHGTDILLVTRSTVRLNRAAIASDLGDLEAALADARALDAAKLLSTIGTAPLIAGMDFGEAFGSWLADRRMEAEHRLQIAVDDALAAAMLRGDAPGHAALRQAWSLRQPPASPAPGAVRAPADAHCRIAILPFQALNAKDGEDYFADGVVDELITTLGQVPQLLVAGRTSSFHFRASELPFPAIAEALGVAHLIEGSVQRQGETVRIFVRLIDGTSGFESWGQRYDGSLDNIFGLQETVAKAVTTALAETLDLDLDAPLIRDMTRSKEAYDLYLQGRALGSRIFGDGVLDNAIHFLEQAVAIDPLFAEAWVELAEAHHNVAVYTQCLDRNAAAQRMAECAHRAIALSPGLGYPYALLGTYEWTRNNLVGGLDYAFEAYARDPRHPGVAMRVASFLLYCGRTEDAVPYVEAAIDKDPIDPRKYALLWSVHFGRGELADALKAGQRVVDLGWPSMYLALTSAALGRHDLAVEQYQQTKRLVNTIILPPVGSGTMTDAAMDAYWLTAAKGVCSGQEADRRAYFQVLEMMHAMLPDKADLAIAGPAIFTGNAELVFKAFGHHLTPANILAFISLWADIEPVRQIWQHEEFIPFAQRIGMAAAWDKYGWPDLLPFPTNRLLEAD